MKCTRCGNELSGERCLICGKPVMKDDNAILTVAEAAEYTALKQALRDAYVGEDNSDLSWEDVRDHILKGGLRNALDVLAEYESELMGGVPRTCRVCGCTDEEGCDSGCYWVGPDLCSRCVDLQGFCESTKCGCLRLKNDEGYAIKGMSHEETVSRLTLTWCASCRAWQLDQFLKAGGKSVPSED